MADEIPEITELKKVTRENVIAEYVANLWMDRHPNATDYLQNAANELSAAHNHTTEAAFKAGKAGVSQVDQATIIQDVQNKTDVEINWGHFKTEIAAMQKELDEKMKLAEQKEVILQARGVMEDIKDGKIPQTEGIDKINNILAPQKLDYTDLRSDYIREAREALDDIKHPENFNPVDSNIGFINRALDMAGENYRALDPNFDLRKPDAPHKSDAEMREVIKADIPLGHISQASEILQDIRDGQIEPETGQKAIEANLKMAENAHGTDIKAIEKLRLDTKESVKSELLKQQKDHKGKFDYPHGVLFPSPDPVDVDKLLKDLKPAPAPQKQAEHPMAKVHAIALKDGPLTASVTIAHDDAKNAALPGMMKPRNLTV